MRVCRTGVLPGSRAVCVELPATVSSTVGRSYCLSVGLPYCLSVRLLNCLSVGHKRGLAAQQQPWGAWLGALLCDVLPLVSACLDSACPVP
jgi:hypothetical protein